LKATPARTRTRWAEAKTRKITRRGILRDRLNKYVVNLRLKDFKVEVYQDRLNAEFNKEAAWIAQLEQKAKAPHSLTKQRAAAMEKLLTP
jgi:hypothetical protein